MEQIIEKWKKLEIEYAVVEFDFIRGMVEACPFFFSKGKRIENNYLKRKIRDIALFKLGALYKSSDCKTEYKLMIIKLDSRKEHFCFERALWSNFYNEIRVVPKILELSTEEISYLKNYVSKILTNFNSFPPIIVYKKDFLKTEESFRIEKGICSKMLSFEKTTTSKDFENYDCEKILFYKFFGVNGIIEIVKESAIKINYLYSIKYREI